MEEEKDYSKIAESICKEKGFTLLNYIGGGAFKKVFAIQDTKNEKFALKIILEPSRRIDREIESLHRCHHRSIARLVDIGVYTYKGRELTFLIEELLTGGSLGDFISKNGLINNEFALFIGINLIGALDHLYKLDLVHRDIKPENIMFRSEGNIPVLVDFGLVRDLSASSLTATWVHPGPGTPYFSSPEQLNNEKAMINWRSDQFSLAVTISFARFGIHPYQYPSEKTYTYETVERVALRGKRHQMFLDTISELSPKCLFKMTEPWPINRFRIPEELAEQWGS